MGAFYRWVLSTDGREAYPWAGSLVFGVPVPRAFQKYAYCKSCPIPSLQFSVFYDDMDYKRLVGILKGSVGILIFSAGILILSVGILIFVVGIMKLLRNCRD